MSTRPPFELESYEDQTLPCGQRLSDERDLVGHTIKAVITHPTGRLGDEVDMVIVTETLCWLVLEADQPYCVEERATVSVRPCRGGQWSHSSQAVKPAETLHDYLGAAEMLSNGLVSHPQYLALVQIEEQANEDARQKKADALRKQLAALEGSAA